MLIWHNALRELVLKFDVQPLSAYGGSQSGIALSEELTLCNTQQNYKKVVEDLVQVVSLQEKDLAEKNMLVADLQEKLVRGGNLLFL
jgi:hypothetical protein